MNLLRLLLRSSKWTVLLAAAAGLAGGAASVGLIALIQVALAREGTSSGMLLAFAGLCLAALFARIASQALMIRLAQGSTYRLYVHLSRQILAVPLRQIEKVGTHRLLAALTEDVPAIAGALLGAPVLCVNAAILVCCLAYLGWLSPPLLLGVLGFLALGAFSYYLGVWQALGRLNLARREQDSLMKHFRGLTEGIKELKLHRDRREVFLGQLLDATAAGLRDHNTAGLTIYAAAGAWGQLLFLVGIGLLLFAPQLEDLPRAVMRGYVLAILYAASPLETIMSWLPIMGRALVALRAVEDLGLSLDAGAEGASVSPSVSPLPCEVIDLDGVTHAYHGAEEDGFHLGPIDFRLRRGELVFVAGGNGSGKTTLAKLLVGLYVPAAGEVRLDGRPVGDGDRESYRQLFSAIFADAYLFDRVLGTEFAAVAAEAAGYLALLELTDKVRMEGERFSTTDLSQGQRKRLALLAAYLEDRPVYVFDEWAADQDPRFKDVFYVRLLPELKARGKAVVVISHDEQYFHLADRVVKLDYGTVSEMRVENDRALCNGTLVPVTSAGA